MNMLETLLARRDAAQAAYEAFATPLIAEDRALTADEETTRVELRDAVVNFDGRIAEVRDDETRSNSLEETRRTLGASIPVVNVNETRTYGPGSQNSYFADLARLAYGHARSDAGDALERLNQHEYEVSVEMARGSDEGKRAEKQIYERRRDAGAAAAGRVVRDMRERGNAGSLSGPEVRGMTAGGSTSGASFVTPVYFINEYAPYREAGRAFADAANHQDLPEYGMTINIPHVTGPAAVATVSEAAAVTETDPTAGYLSAGLSIIAGQVVVTQTLLDRAGPGFAFDKLVFDQLSRDYAPKVDVFTLTQALAGAGSIAYTDASGFTLTARTAPGSGGFYGKVSGAKAAIRTGAGVFANPTHLFLQPNRWEYISAWADSQGRPVVVPGYANPMNGVSAGNSNGDTGVEGATGYRLNGLPVFQDFNIPTPGTGADQAIVAEMDEVYLFEGTPVTRALPQTLAGNLQVILQQYSYVACIVRYPTAVQTISGTGMAAISF